MRLPSCKNNYPSSRQLRHWASPANCERREIGTERPNRTSFEQPTALICPHFDTDAQRRPDPYPKGRGKYRFPTYSHCILGAMFTDLTPHPNLWLIQNLSGKWGKQEGGKEVGMTAERRRKSYSSSSKRMPKKRQRVVTPKWKGTARDERRSPDGRNLFSARAVKTEEEI